MPAGKRAYLRLYMDGQRVPVQSASVSGAVGTHTQATITIPPMPLVTKLKPRTLVTVETKDSAGDPYRLLFQGEYITYKHSEDTGQRAFVLVCVGLTNYWDTTYQAYLDLTSLAGYGQRELASFAGGIEDLQIPGLGSVVAQTIIRQGSNIQQALLSIAHLMANTAGGKNGDLASPRINLHLERAYSVLRLGERVSVIPDAEIRNLINAKTATEVITQTSGSLGGLAPLSQVLRTFLAFAYYDWVAVVAPSYTPRNTVAGTATSPQLDFHVPNGSNAEETLGVTATTADNAKTRGLDTKNVQRDVILKPKTYFLPPPVCNVFFPCMFERFSSSRSFLQEPTRMRVSTQAIPWPTNSGGTNAFGVMTFYAPSEIEPAIRGEAASVGASIETAELGKALATESPVKYSYATLLKQTQNGGIDEQITGVIPAFDALGFAEYSAVQSEVGPSDAQRLAGGSITVASEPDEADVKARSDQEKVDEAGFKAARDPISGTLQKYLREVAQYKLDMARAASKTIEGITGPLNLNPVAGFPGLVFSKIAIYSGEILNVNQSVSAAGMAFTAVTLGLVRELDLLPGTAFGTTREKVLLLKSLRAVGTAASITRESFVAAATNVFKTELKAAFDLNRLNELILDFDPVDRLPAQPAWLNASYKAENIGAKVYGPLLGVKSTAQLAGPTGPVLNQVVAANIIFLEYLLSSDRAGYAKKTTSRTITTGKQAMCDYLGFADPGNSEPDKTKGFQQQDLTATMLKSSQTINGFENANIPVQISRVKAVKNYVKLLSGQARRGLRG